MSQRGVVRGHIRFHARTVGGPEAAEFTCPDGLRIMLNESNATIDIQGPEYVSVTHLHEEISQTSKKPEHK